MKKKKNYFLRILSLLFLIFISLYIAMESGYYEAKLSKKTTMTEESIKKFESDIKNGKPIDINSYSYNEFTDYSNNTTNLAIFVGENVEKFMTSGINSVFEFLKSLVT